MTDEIEKVIEQRNKLDPPRRQLTGADVAIVIAMLVFIIVWVGGWIWGLTVTDQPPEKVKWWVAVIIFLIVAGPAFWASNMISHILGKDD